MLILAFAPKGGIILDPFAGSGTTCLVAQSMGFDFIGFDIMKDYVELANNRLRTEQKYARPA
jgi:DNA modification methylase